MKVNPSDNADNLPEKYFEILANMTESQRLRFEQGEWASEVAGALWTVEQLDACRVKPSQLPEMRRIVVAVDPSGTKGDGKGDDVGIVVAGVGTDGKGYILEDATCQLGPEGWSRRAVDMYHRHRADRIVAERNYGGAMVEAMIRVADPNVPFTEVTATRGKVVRAEPVSALYELGKVFHAGSFPELEDQMCAMTPAGYVGEKSPDRADALVWAMTELLVDGSTYTLAGW
jgi:predicted phage terminase large subunit-like protein